MLNDSKAFVGNEWVYPAGLLYHYIFTISRLRLPSLPKSTLFLLDTSVPGASREEMINI